MVTLDSFFPAGTGLGTLLDRRRVVATLFYSAARNVRSRGWPPGRPLVAHVRPLALSNDTPTWHARSLRIHHNSLDTVLCAFGKLRNLSRNLTGSRHTQLEAMNLEEARTQMLGQQIRAWEVLDERVLDVLGAVPRESFVPEAQRALAFADLEIPLAHNQQMMTPKVEGRLLQALTLDPADSVLEVGTGSGFLTACLARLAKSVVSVDIYEDFTLEAKNKVGDLDISNVEFRALDALQMDEQEKFDAIAVTGSVPEQDEHFIQMLRPGGRLFIIVGRAPVMEARVATMHANGEIERESLFESVISPLINAERPEPFVL